MSSAMTGGGYPNSRQNANLKPTGGEGPPAQNSASIRTAFRAAFDYPRPDSDQLSTLLMRRLAVTPAIQTQIPIRVQLQGRTAILRGVVSTEHDRRLAEQMIRLEPGIELVKNEIVVANPDTGGAVAAVEGGCGVRIDASLPGVGKRVANSKFPVAAPPTGRSPEKLPHRSTAGCTPSRTGWQS